MSIIKQCASEFMCRSAEVRYGFAFPMSAAHRLFIGAVTVAIPTDASTVKRESIQRITFEGHNSVTFHPKRRFLVIRLCFQ